MQTKTGSIDHDRRVFVGNSFFEFNLFARTGGKCGPRHLFVPSSPGLCLPCSAQSLGHNIPTSLIENHKASTASTSLLHADATMADFDPRHTYVTSPFLTTPLLAGIRGVLGLYTLVSNIVALAWTGIKGGDAGS